MMESVNVPQLIQERDGVIAERRQAFSRWANAKEAEKIRIHGEFILPLNQQLLKLNKRLGL